MLKKAKLFVLFVGIMSISCAALAQKASAPQPGKPVPRHACRDQCAGPQHALVEEFRLPRTKAVDRVRIGRVVRRKSSGISSFGLSCRGTAGRTGGSKQLDSAIGPAPGLG